MAVVLYHLLRHLCQHTFGQGCRWSLQAKKEKNRLKMKNLDLNIQMWDSGNSKVTILLQTVSEHLSLFENVSAGDYASVKIELMTHLPRFHEWPGTDSVFKSSLLLFSMHGIKTQFNSNTEQELETWNRSFLKRSSIFPHWPCKPHANIKQRNQRLAPNTFRMAHPRQCTKEHFMGPFRLFPDLSVPDTGRDTILSLSLSLNPVIYD